MRAVSLFSFGALICLSCLSLGCGSGGSGVKVDLVPVSGVVTLDGEPLANASVLFSPTGQSQAQPSHAITDDSGNYSLAYADGRPGCATGFHVVVISKFAQQDGTPFPPGTPPDEASVNGKEHLAAEYSSHTATRLNADVKEVNEPFNFELKRKK